MSARPRLWRIFRNDRPAGQRRVRSVYLGTFRGNLREVREEVRSMDSMMGEGSLFGHDRRSKHSAIPVRAAAE